MTAACVFHFHTWHHTHPTDSHFLPLLEIIAPGWKFTSWTQVRYWGTMLQELHHFLAYIFYWLAYQGRQDRYSFGCLHEIFFNWGNWWAVCLFMVGQSYISFTGLLNSRTLFVCHLNLHYRFGLDVVFFCTSIWVWRYEKARCISGSKEFSGTHHSFLMFRIIFRVMIYRWSRIYRTLCIEFLWRTTYYPLSICLAPSNCICIFFYLMYYLFVLYG